MTENEEDIITWCEHGADKKCKHVLKLEADLNFALNMSKKRGDEILQLEKEKAELVEFIKLMNEYGKLSPELLATKTDIIYHDSSKLLKKHGVEI